MRRALAWIAGLAGVAALGRAAARRRRRQPTPPAPAAPADSTATDPAEDLRARLTEQRQHEADAPRAEGAETIDERRARIHAKAQEAIGEMREPSA